MNGFLPLQLADVRSPRLRALHDQALLWGWSAQLHTERSWSTDSGTVTDESGTFERHVDGADIVVFCFATRAGLVDESIGGVARIGVPAITQLLDDYAAVAVALHDLAAGS